MRFRGTAFLSLVLLVLGGWVYWTDVRGREERQLAEDRESLALPLESGEIEEIRLEYPERTLAAARSEDGWTFLEPEGLEADAAAWDQVAANVGRVMRGDPVVEEAPDLAQYGLEAPAVRVRVRLADQTTREILFGGENPAGGFHYTRLGSEPGVFLTAATWRDLFLEEADDLRDRRLVVFEPGAVEGITISTGVRLVLEAGAWYLEGPPRLRADDTEVATFLGRLQTARATGFAPPGAALSGAALSGIEVRLHATDADADHVLVFGPPAPDAADGVLAGDLSREPVFIVGADLRDLAASRPAHWRDRTILDLDPDAVRSITLERGEDTILLEKSADEWRLAGGGEAVSTPAVRDMLEAFDFRRAAEVIDRPGALGAYGLENPEIRVVFGMAAGDDIAFAFGSAAPNDTLYWQRQGEDAVRRVPAPVRAPFAADLATLTGAP